MNILFRYSEYTPYIHRVYTEYTPTFYLERH